MHSMYVLLVFSFWDRTYWSYVKSFTVTGNQAFAIRTLETDTNNQDTSDTMGRWNPMIYYTCRFTLMDANVMNICDEQPPCIIILDSNCIETL